MWEGTNQMTSQKGLSKIQNGTLAPLFSVGRKCKERECITPFELLICLDANQLNKISHSALKEDTKEKPFACRYPLEYPLKYLQRILYIESQRDTLRNRTQSANQASSLFDLELFHWHKGEPLIDLLTPSPWKRTQVIITATAASASTVLLWI